MLTVGAGVEPLEEGEDAATGEDIVDKLLFVVRILDRLTAKLVNLLTAKLVNHLTARLVDHLTAKLVLVNLVKLHLTKCNFN